MTDLKIRLINRLVLGISLFRLLSYKFFQKKRNWSTDCVYFLVFDYNFFWKTLKSNSAVKRIISKNNNTIWSIDTFVDRDFLTLSAIWYIPKWILPVECVVFKPMDPQHYLRRYKHNLIQSEFDFLSSTNPQIETCLGLLSKNLYSTVSEWFYNLILFSCIISRFKLKN